MITKPVAAEIPIIRTALDRVEEISAASVVEAPTALYVHVPWCVRKCPYCDFNSHVVPGSGLPDRNYVAAALADLDWELTDRPQRAGALVAVFLGGGTPSLLAPAAVAELLAGIRSRMDVPLETEVTLEANPGTIERGRFAEYAAAGITRVSLGVQSFSDGMLQRLGRIHSSRDATRSIEELHAAGLTNFNLDLMYGLPGQTVSEALDDLELAVSLGPAHLSWYELTLEPGTAFFQRPPVLPVPDEIEAMETAGRKRLQAAGLQRYEVSAYARPGRRCRHNDNYWGYGDYIGIGPGAHGKRSAGARVIRTERIRSPARWLRLAGRAEALTVTSVAARERPFEFCLGALRRPEGFDWGTFARRTGLDRAVLTGAISGAQEVGLVEVRPDGIRPTALGLRYLNDLQARMLVD